MPVVIKENIVLKREDYIPMKPWVSPNRKIGFLPTPKAASSTMSRILSHENYWIRDVEADTLYALVRHPYDRWISGTTEHWNPILTRWANDLQPLINTDFATLLEQSFRDRHTQPQAWNFDKYSNIKLFKFEHLSMLLDYLDIDRGIVHERNHLTMGGIQKNVREIVADKAEYQPIINLYREDMQLWRRAL